MKRGLHKILLPIALIFLVASCLPGTNIEALKKTRKVALISVMSDDTVDTSNVTGGSLIGMVANATQGDATAMAGKLTKVKNLLIKRSGAIFKFKMVPERQVVSQKGYKAITTSPLVSMIAPKGYKVIAYNEKEKIAAAIGKLNGVDAAMIVSLKCRLVKQSDWIGAGGRAILWGDMTFYLIDKKGESILWKTVSNPSKTTAYHNHGVFVGADLQKMINEVIETNLKEIAVYMQKELKKSVKKAS